MRRFFKTFLFSCLLTGITFAQGGAPTCNELQTNPALYQSCATNIPFINQTTSNSETITPSCFGEPPKAPTWFFTQVQNSGTINLQISQISNMGNGIDVDFCLWGPFTTVTNVCPLLISSNEVDCSWLPATVENVTIPNAIQNQIYILLVDNYVRLPGTISIAQTGGTGSSDCGFLSSVKIKDTSNNEITQLNYCAPETKTLKAIVNTSNFTGNLANLRFNYRWKKDGVIVASLNNSISNTNTFAATATGVYRIEIASYDVTDPNIDINAIPFPQDQYDNISLTFFETAVLNSTTINVEQCDFISPNNDGTAAFNLTQYYNQITNSTAGINLKFYKNINLTEEITNPTNFVNTIPFSQNIYVVGQIAINSVSCPSNICILNLKITPTSAATYPDILPNCSVLNQNFGFIDFDAQRLIIKNSFFPTTTVDIQFYGSQIDATLEQNALSNSSQLSIGSMLIYTKIKSGTNCTGIGTFIISIKSSPVLSAVTTVRLCKSDTFTPNSKDSQVLLNQNPTVETNYFLSFDDAKNNSNSINKNVPYPLLAGTTPIYIRLFDTLSQCFSIIMFDLIVVENPVFNTNIPAYAVCGVSNGVFNLNSKIYDLIGNQECIVSFYETQQDLNNNLPIVNPANYSSSATTIYVKATGNAPTNCTAQATLQLEVNQKPGSDTNPTPFLKCDNTGFFNFDLRLKESEMAGASPLATIVFEYYENLTDAILRNSNAIANPASYTNSTKNYQKLFVRISNVDPLLFCFSILELSIFVSEFPKNNLDLRPYRICTFANGAVSDDAFIDTKLIPEDYTFQWFSGSNAIAGNEIIGQNNSTFSTPIAGDFSVKIISKLTPASCETIANFSTVILMMPRVLKLNPDELITFEVENKVTAIATPYSDDYEYLLNFGDWQSSPTFTNLPAGPNIIKVRNKFGCKSIESTFFVVDYRKFFTPNGDGYNDFWKLDGDIALDVTTTYIFDKFGKLLYEHKKFSQGWDGTFQGQPMPADDYWFRVLYTNKNEKKEFKGHFTLKR